MNNKKVFSVKLFWQSFKQLKTIGIICTVILYVLSVLPVVTEVIDIVRAERMGIEAVSYPSIVNAVSYTSFLVITFIIFAPMLALNCWKFLNKRSTSDFYHSLPHKRICLFLSRLAAVLAWLFVMYLISFAGTTAGFAIFSKYFIVDYYVIFRMYVAMFICCILCVAAISLACSFTGNMLTNVCMTGIILFLPRGLIDIISGSVAGSVYVMNAEDVIPLFGNNANMITNIIFGAFFSGSVDLQEMILSPVSNIYTLVLGIIYTAVAAALFITRKSECAGKSAIGKASRFFIRTVICFSICAVMVLPVLCSKNNTSDIGRIYYIIMSFIVAGVALVIYECIQSKNIKSVIACLPAMALSYVVTLFIGAVVNVGTAGILEYNPKMEDVDYITLAQSLDQYGYYSSSSERDYFKFISSDIKIEDKKIINEICKAIENCNNLVKDKKIENVIYSGDSNKRYEAYDVYIKDSSIGHNRKVYLSQEAIKIISENMSSLDSYKEAYLNLPDADSVDISSYMVDNKEQKKEIYNILLEEIKTIKFADWYQNVNSEAPNFSINIKFSRKGYIYSANIPVTEKLPKTMQAIFNAVNESAYKDKASLDKLLENLELAKEGRFKTDKDRYENISVSVETVNREDGEYYDIEDYMSQNPNIAPEVIGKLIDAIKNKNYGKTIDTSKPYVCIDYSYEDYDNVFKVYNITYYTQLEGFDDVSDYGRSQYR